MENNSKNIIESMNTLKKHFNYTDRTTLNQMKGNEEAFKILISCLLSLRTKDEITEKVSANLFKIANTPQEIINLPTKQLEKIIFSTGHYKKKAQILKHVSQELLSRFKGEVPKTREELISIKGIGPKTANIVLNFAFGEDVLPIDTHCHRIPNRLGWIETKNAEASEFALMKVLPKEYWGDFNGIFVLFGKNICQPISPFCSKCPIEANCPKIGVIKTR
jgi:endonuclease III